MKRKHNYLSHLSGVAALLAIACPAVRASGPAIPATTIDFSSRFGAIRDQGSSNWCSQFSAADLLGFELGIAPPDEISPIDVLSQAAIVDFSGVGTSASSITLVDDLSGDEGNAGLLIEDINQQAISALLDPADNGATPGTILAPLLLGSYCPERELPSQSLKYESSVNAESPYLINLLESIEKQSGLGPGVTASSMGFPRINSILNARCATRRPIQFRSALLEVAYSATVFLPGWGIDPAALLNKIDTHLEQGHPALLDIDSDRIQMTENPVGSANTDSLLKRFDTITMSDKLNQLKTGGWTSKETDHAVLVIGRRPLKTGPAYEYLVRNSWGDQMCNTYIPEIRATCVKSTGYFWISGEMLKNITGMAVWLEIHHS